jgi:hypothetical protein
LPFSVLYHFRRLLLQQTCPSMIWDSSGRKPLSRGLVL